MLLVIFACQREEVDRHAAYGEFLRAHPFNQRPDSLDWLQERAKADRPDRAFEHNYIMTMDPALGRPAPERLEQARNILNRRAKNAGTPDLVWEERGPYEVGGRTRALMFDPNDPSLQKVWAGGVTGGLWYNNNIGGNTEWQPVDDFWQTLSVSSITYDPANPQVFYVGTGEPYARAGMGQGVWKSADGGQTWQQLTATLDFTHITDLVVRQEGNQGVLYVAVRNEVYRGSTLPAGVGGIYRSTDGGQSFSQVIPQIPGESYPYAVADLEIDANNRLWVGTIDASGASGNPGGGDILYSDDGLNYNLAYASDGDRVELAVAPSNAAFVYALIERFQRIFEVKRSMDSGQTWLNLPLPNDADPGIPANDFTRGQGWYDLIAQVDPNDETSLFVGGINLFQSQDTGNAWIQMSHWYGGFNQPYVHADQHQIVYQPGSSTNVLFGHDGGVSYYSNSQSLIPEFRTRNEAYNVTQFYSCALHPEKGSDVFLGGTQDNGTPLFSQPGLGQTVRATGGDGGFCFIDQDNPDFMITSYIYNTWWRSFNGGNSFGNRFVNDLSNGRFINPADYDDALNIIYAARDFTTISRITNVDGNPSEESFRLWGMFDLASALKVSPYTKDSTTLFVGSGAGKLFRVENADEVQGTLRSYDITGNNFPAGYISCIQVGRDEKELLVTFSNYGLSSIWYTSDGGNTWSEKEGNLPDMPVRWALFNPMDYNVVIVATELGVWMCKDLSAPSPDWQPVNNGLANVRTDMLQWRASDNVILAATHGRGMFTSRFESGIGLEETAAETKALLHAYPNPVGETLYLEQQAGAQREWRFVLLDQQGRTVRDGWLSLKTGQPRGIPTENLRPGVYFLKAESAKGLRFSTRLMRN